MVLDVLRARTPACAGSLLLGISGGADSMALLHGYHMLEAYRVEVAHVDHGIRGDSNADAEFVRAQCEKRGLKFHLRRLTPPEVGNLEQWGRTERYRYFSELLESRRLDLIVTAHQADDCAETLLMRLVTNKDLRGIIGQDERRRCLRPLLQIYRRDIEEFLQENNVSFVEDPTNADTSYLRNRVRHELIPFLNEQFEGDMIRILASRAQTIVDDLAALDELVSSELAELADDCWGEREWTRQLVRIFQGVSAGVRWRVAEEVLASQVSFRVGRRKSEEFVEMLLSNTAGMQLPGGFQVRRSGGGVTLTPLTDDAS
jgi:tRNA(Ile)-lysidine synthetase-like protein